MCTVEGLEMDLALAVESGVVLDTGTIGDYNDIEDPRSISRRVRDVFDAMDIQKSLFKSGQVKGSSVSKSTKSTNVNPTGESGV